MDMRSECFADMGRDTCGLRIAVVGALQGTASGHMDSGALLQPGEQPVLIEVIQEAFHDSAHGPMIDQALVGDVGSVAMDSVVLTVKPSQTFGDIRRHPRSCQVHLADLPGRPSATEFRRLMQPPQSDFIILFHAVATVEINLRETSGFMSGARYCLQDATLTDVPLPDPIPPRLLSLIWRQADRWAQPTRLFIEHGDGLGNELIVLVSLQVPFKVSGLLLIRGFAGADQPCHGSQSGRIAQGRCPTDPLRGIFVAAPLMLPGRPIG